MEEDLFQVTRTLFTGLDLFFLDTTSLYFEGEGGQTLGEKGHSKDHRPDLNQMVVGTLIDDTGRPVCCEIWPGNTADVKTLVPVADRVPPSVWGRLFCLVADRGMISQETMKELEDRKLPYILGARMRLVKEIREEVLSRAGRYQEVVPEGISSKDPAPLKVKEVFLEGKRYIVCLNAKQARKEAWDRQVILEALGEKLKNNPKALIGNKGYRKYLTLDRDLLTINQNKVDDEARFDGKWVLQTNTDLPAARVASEVQGTLAGRASLSGYKVCVGNPTHLSSKRRNDPGPCVLQFPGFGPEERIAKPFREIRILFRVVRYQTGFKGPSGSHHYRPGAGSSPFAQNALGLAARSSRLWGWLSLPLSVNYKIFKEQNVVPRTF